MRYLAIIEGGGEGWGAYVPDFSGCIAAAESRAEIERMIAEALVFHFEGLLLAGQPIPEPVSDAITVDVPIPTRAGLAQIA